MTAEEMFKMSNKEFMEAVKKESTYKKEEDDSVFLSPSNILNLLKEKHKLIDAEDATIAIGLQLAIDTLEEYFKEILKQPEWLTKQLEDFSNCKTSKESVIALLKASEYI